MSVAVIADQKTEKRMAISCSLRRVATTALLATALMSVLLEAATAAVIYENDFDDDPAGTYTVSNLSADWNGVTSNDGVDEGRVSITDDDNAFGNKSLVIMYPEGESNLGKSQWKMPLGAAYDELFLSYRIRFDNDFDFVRGGKLPGLCGGACNSGGSMPNGTDGWSARMMWRTNGSGGSPTTGDSANIVQYVYHPDQTANGGINGDDLKWDDTTPTDWKTFDSDTWYHLQHRVVMNTPGQHDGIVQAWLDGEMVLDKRDIRFRDISSIQIDTLYFSTFFGGSSSVWEATKDEHVYFDNFVIATEFITNPGDFDGDGDVDDSDLGLWESAYSTSNGGDADGDLDTDGADFLIWQQQFTGDLAPPLSASTSVPEPASAMLLIGVAALGIHSRTVRSAK